jgi:transcriptional regulator with XRE-family HTH domain
VDDDVRPAFGRRVRQVRLRMKLSQEQLAART